MANSAQATKRVRQAEKRRQRNTAQRSTMRSAVKGAVKAIEAGDKEKAADAYKAAVSAVDCLVSKGLVHKNKAARDKSRLNTRLRAL